MPISLGELATQFGCELIGDPDVIVADVASLHNAGPGTLTFLSNSAFKEHLSSTRAAAVIVRPGDAEGASTAVLINDNPYACYARMAAVVHPPPVYKPGVDCSAVISATASISDTAHIAANAVVGDRSSIGDNSYVGPGCVVGTDCAVGRDCRLIANVTLVKKVTLGARVMIHPGAVIGADGFGNAKTSEGWVKIPQLGGVQIGDDVEIGANTTIDCGALDDTVLEDGVRLDNLVMIAHNVRVGAHTAMVAMVAIGGSTVIGKRCLFAGMAGVVGHITICDDAVINGQGMITKNITEPGAYASSFPSVKAQEWNRMVARVRRLDILAERVKKLEKSSK